MKIVLNSVLEEVNRSPDNFTASYMNMYVLFCFIGVYDFKSATMIGLSAIILLISTFHFIKEVFQVYYSTMFSYLANQGTFAVNF